MKANTDNEFSICEHCDGEIYDNDIICDLAAVYGDGCCIVHEECAADSLNSNRELAQQYIFDDLSRLAEVFERLLSKYVAWEYLEGYDDGE